jgi:hypothetical protein
MVVMMSLSGVGLLIAAAVSEINYYALSRHGIRTVATVAYVQGYRTKSASYLLHFNDAQGTPTAERTGSVLSGTKVGDQITVVYDPDGPANIKDVRVLEGGRWNALVPAAGALFFLGGARLHFRMNPDEFRFMWRIARTPNRYRLLYNRHGAPR